MKLTVPEAARRVGRSPETVRRWIWSGRLPAEKVGNQHVIDLEVLDALIAPLAGGTGASPVEVRGAWGAWLGRARPVRERMRARGARIPAGAALLRESRRGR